MGRQATSGVGTMAHVCVVNSSSQATHSLEEPRVFFSNSRVVSWFVLYESDLPAAVSRGVFQTSELPISLFPVSLRKATVEFGQGLKIASPSPCGSGLIQMLTVSLFCSPEVPKLPSLALPGRGGTRGARSHTAAPTGPPALVIQAFSSASWLCVTELDLAKPGILSVRTSSPAEEAFPDHSYCGKCSSSRNAGWEASRNSK